MVRRKRKQRKIRKKGKRLRNPYALQLRLRGGAGNHGDRRKAASKKKCRGRVAQDEG